MSLSVAVSGPGGLSVLDVSVRFLWEVSVVSTAGLTAPHGRLSSGGVRACLRLPMFLLVGQRFLWCFSWPEPWGPHVQLLHVPELTYRFPEGTQQQPGMAHPQQSGSQLCDSFSPELPRGTGADLCSRSQPFLLVLALLSLLGPPWRLPQSSGPQTDLALGQATCWGLLLTAPFTPNANQSHMLWAGPFPFSSK